MSEKPVREYDKFMLRFPDGMRDAIAERAKANGRSMNSEIVQMLTDTLVKDEIFAGEIDETEKDYFPGSENEKISTSKKELNDLMNKAVRAIVDTAADQIAKNAAESMMEAIAEQYELIPRDNKKPT